MQKSSVFSAILFVLLSTEIAIGVPAPARAGDLRIAPPKSPHSQAAQSARLGRVNFPISCAPSVQEPFNKGVALLHSFQYEEAEQTFAAIAQQDPQCAMAYWGEAMSLYHQLWDWPSDDTLKQGRQFIQEALKLRAKTERERVYIVAAAVFFQDNPKLSHASRVGAYSGMMNKLFTKNPDDVNAGAWYALSLIALPAKGADELANREKAIDILNKLFAVAPYNPGVVHYLIHATDTPELAPQGLAAARRYAKIAPDSSHALHMPSHIFVRLGLWKDSIASNIAAAAAAAQATQTRMANEASNYQIHAMDFLDYSYLQSGQEAKARQVADDLKNVPGASAGEIADNQAMFEARNALELHQWKEAAALAIPNVQADWQDTTYFARAIGAARSGDAAGAQEDIAKLNASIAPSPAESMKQGYGISSGGPLEVQEAEAWLDYATGKSDEAVKLMRAAAEQEEAEGVDSLAMPAREMLGDLLFELKRPADALAAYKAALVKSPNRFDSLYGAAVAAQLSGDAKVARQYFSKLVEVCGAGADRPELAEARVELAKKEQR